MGRLCQLQPSLGLNRQRIGDMLLNFWLQVCSSGSFSQSVLGGIQEKLTPLIAWQVVCPEEAVFFRGRVYIVP
jgi:hypothetical protein